MENCILKAHAIMKSMSCDLINDGQPLFLMFTKSFIHWYETPIPIQICKLLWMGTSRQLLQTLNCNHFAKCLHFSFYLLRTLWIILSLSLWGIEWLFIRHNIREEDDDDRHVIFCELCHTFSISQWQHTQGGGGRG
jgi:hypothetical protein